MKKIAKVDFRLLFLLGLLVFLPGFEALKNIFAFLFVLSCLLSAKRNNDWGGRWQIIDTIFLLWILADTAISINAVINHELSGAGFRDVIRFVLIAWVLSRTFFSSDYIPKIAIASVIATTLTLAYSYYSTIDGSVIELPSVGHINHTAIYLVISYSLSLSLLLFSFNSLKNHQKLILIFTSLILFFATVQTESRASFGLLILITLVNFIYLVIKVRKPSIIYLFMGILLCVGIAYVHKPPVALERLFWAEHIFQDESRHKIRAFSYYAFRENPFLGVGFGNYGQIKIDDIKESIIDHKGVFDGSLYIPSSHAHNVYYTYLVSGGLLIFSIFLWFWFYIVWILFKLRSSMENEWIILSSISVLLINLGIGWVNTTLHHEHAILSMVVLGMLISEYRKAEHRRNLHVP